MKTTSFQPTDGKSIESDSSDIKKIRALKSERFLSMIV